MMRSWSSLVLTWLLLMWGTPGPSLVAAELERVLATPTTSIYRWESTCHTYVIQRGERALLIDLGDGGVLENLPGIGVERVDWIVFTSHHRERSQGIARVDRSQTRIAAPEAERELFEDPLAFRKWYPRLGDKYSVYGASYVRPPRLPLHLDRPLADGELFTSQGLTTGPDHPLSRHSWE
jgi:glyoxylase-like metal-dependent hydrolase (beta-lactamase superfamily II)